jgi:aryl-alcohol dehydrogenase-like predicted oxidoreductase
MARGSRETTGEQPAEATRRRVLSTIAIGAAYTACGRPAKEIAGMLDAGPAEQPRPRPSGPSAGADAGPGTVSPPDPEVRADAGAASAPDAPAASTTPPRKSASDQVVLGATGIKVSRLAMGSGTHGSGGTSSQTQLGVDAFARLLVRSYHEQGITFWETADGYGAHPHLKEGIRQVGRQNLVILTKTTARTAKEMQADLDRFRTELGTDMIDTVLLHAVTSGTWTQDLAGAMDVLEQAKSKGIIRAHGTSCHSLQALRLAARTPWVDVDFARINPATIEMDADPATVISVLRQMKAAGKGVVGMKILGVGQLAKTMDTAIRHAVQLDALDAFTIGFTSYAQLEQVTAKIAQLG